MGSHLSATLMVQVQVRISFPRMARNYFYGKRQQALLDWNQPLPSLMTFCFGIDCRSPCRGKRKKTLAQRQSCIPCVVKEPSNPSGLAMKANRYSNVPLVQAVHKLTGAWKRST
jgi:hypothetical protein